MSSRSAVVLGCALLGGPAIALAQEAGPLLQNTDAEARAMFEKGKASGSSADVIAAGTRLETARAR